MVHKFVLPTKGEEQLNRFEFIDDFNKLLSSIKSSKSVRADALNLWKVLKLADRFDPITTYFLEWKIQPSKAMDTLIKDYAGEVAALPELSELEFVDGSSPIRL